MLLRRLVDYFVIMGLVWICILLILAPLDKALSATPELPAVAYPSPYMVDASTVVQVVCSDLSAGSAVYLGAGEYVTAAHVMMGEKRPSLLCFIDGQPVTIEHINVVADWALIRADHYPKFRAIISCERLQGGQAYFAAGYADGNPWLVTTRLRAAGIRENQSAGVGVGTADVSGSLVSGMSGGAVSDIDGVVHAISDWRDDDGVPVGGVVELADTPLCLRASGERNLFQ